MSAFTLELTRLAPSSIISVHPFRCFDSNLGTPPVARQRTISCDWKPSLDQFASRDHSVIGDGRRLSDTTAAVVDAIATAPHKTESSCSERGQRISKGIDRLSNQHRAVIFIGPPANRRRDDALAYDEDDPPPSNRASR